MRGTATVAVLLNDPRDQRVGIARHVIVHAGRLRRRGRVVAEQMTADRRGENDAITARLTLVRARDSASSDATPPHDTDSRKLGSNKRIR